MPVLFLGHGSPMLALENSAQAQFLKNLSASLPRPKAILALSAHWETAGTQILELDSPETIYDFRGFPAQLSKIKYPAKGDRALAQKVAELLPEAKLSRTWGFDHGVWSVLIHMYPNAEIPVLCLSLDQNLGAKELFDLGRQLAPLRDEGVLILGSGNIVHNLRAMDHSGEVYDWAKKFDEFIKQAILKNDHEALFRYEELGCAADLSVPTTEHLFPLFPF